MSNGATLTKPQNSSLDAESADLRVPQPPDPVPWFGSLILGIYFFGVAAITFYLLVATWPVSDPKGGSGFAELSLFGSASFSAPPDLRLFFTVIAAGALGSLIHSITSFADYVGNRRLAKSWIWWLILRMPVGVALALLFYLVLRGGLIVPSLPNGSAAANTSHLLNPYGIAAISALAGMFAKQATDKLREIFDTLFRTREPVKRADPLARAIPVITNTQPTTLTVGGPPTLSVFGRGFQRDCTASINGKPRNVQWISDTSLAITLVAEDLSVKTELQLIVQNPGPDGGDSEPLQIPVENA
jgi:IPT/TIG domain